MDYKVEIRWVEETDSTQDEARRHISSHDNLSVVAAESQTAGRGQRGNSWLSRKGDNLTFTMVLRFGKDGFPPLEASRQFVITKAATLAVASYLAEKGVQASIKWPNDIYVRNKKICGMLIENILDGGKVSASLVGIGLNVNQMDFPPQLANPTSMSVVTGRRYDVKDEMEVLAGFLAASFMKILSESDTSESDKEYEATLYRKDEFHEYTLCSDDSTFEGKITGVTPVGLLCLTNKKGERFQFAFKEISYII